MPLIVLASAELRQSFGRASANHELRQSFGKASAKLRHFLMISLTVLVVQSGWVEGLVAHNPLTGSPSCAKMEGGSVPFACGQFLGTSVAVGEIAPGCCLVFFFRTCKEPPSFVINGRVLD
jgi:hypothetical protein